MRFEYLRWFLIRQYEDYHALARQSLHGTLDLHTLCDLAVEMTNQQYESLHLNRVFQKHGS